MADEPCPPALDRPIGPYKDGAEPLIVWLIGVKYPARLPEVYRTWLKRPFEECPIDGYAREVLASKLPRDQKVTLLEEGARSEGRLRRIAALEVLAQFEPKVLAKYLWLELTRVQTEHALADWAWREFGARLRWPEWGIGTRLARLTEVANDPKCWDALAGAGKAVGVTARLDLIWRFGADRSPDQNDPSRSARIRFLLQFLNDPTREACAAWDGVTVRDHATDWLAILLGFHIERPARCRHPGETRGPFSRLLFRAAVAKAAAEELERLKK